MSQGDEKLVGSSQVAEQEVAIEDNAPSQGYPLSAIESRKTTGSWEIENANIYMPRSLVDEILDLEGKVRKIIDVSRFTLFQDLYVSE